MYFTCQNLNLKVFVSEMTYSTKVAFSLNLMTTKLEIKVAVLQSLSCLYLLSEYCEAKQNQDQWLDLAGWKSLFQCKQFGDSKTNF